MRALLVDIEGTTSAISFVHEVLFPYARRALPAFVREHRADPAVRRELAAVAAEAGLAEDDSEGQIRTLLEWIDADRKATPLKTLQGMVWEAGYRDGAYRAHVYPDAVAALRAWHDAGLPIHIYSSGSIRAQQLFFRHSEAGDLEPLISGFFDTTSGAKRETAAYHNIARALALAPGEIAFLSDVPEELDAARSAGVDTTWVLREEEGRFRLADAAGSVHRVISKLTELPPEALIG